MGDAAQIHADDGEGLAGAVVEFAGDAAALLILDLHDAPGEFAKLLGLTENVGVTRFEFASAYADFGVEGAGEIFVLLFAAGEGFIGALAIDAEGELTGDSESEVELFLGEDVRLIEINHELADERVARNERNEGESGDAFGEDDGLQGFIEGSRGNIVDDDRLGVAGVAGPR